MNLKIYTDNIEELAQRQITRLLAQPAFAGSKVRIMPDVHAGKGCVIGFTADLGEKVIPNIVGVDIGCGMYTVALGNKKPDFNMLDTVIHRHIPSGMEVHQEALIPFEQMESLHCYSKLLHVPRLYRSLGSLGGGNHFVEVDVDSSGQYYLIIHSGSRNLGHQVCETYQSEAIAIHAGVADRAEREAAIIADYKASGRHREIQTAINALRVECAAARPEIPQDLCYLEGEARLRYLEDMRICQQFALLNRETMAKIIIEHLGLNVQHAFHTTHNYIDHESNIVRKGAISAQNGERVLIPINMRDGCIYGVGKGNEDWNYSAPHGAGRIMSRKQALKNLSLDEYRASMSGIFSTSINLDTLDEAPMAYKGMDEILSHISPTVEVVDIFKPVYNFKAAE